MHLGLVSSSSCLRYVLVKLYRYNAFYSGTLVNKNKNNNKRTREEAFEASTQRGPSGFEYAPAGAHCKHLCRFQREREDLEDLAIIASQVANAEEVAAPDAYFGPLTLRGGTTPRRGHTSRGGSTPGGSPPERSMPGGGATPGGTLRPLQQPPRRRGGVGGCRDRGHGCRRGGSRGASTPAYARGNEAMFGPFQL